MNVIYTPRNVVASFTDQYGEERIIHAPKGRALRLAKNSDTPAARMNRAAAVLLGENVRAARLSAGMTMQALGERAGLKNANQKAYINSLEKAIRQEGMRLGTLYAIASALGCEAGSLLPSVEAVREAAGVRFSSAVALEAA